MVRPVDGNGYYTPYFEGRVRDPASNPQASVRTDDADGTKGASGSAVFGFLSGNMDERKPHEKSENRRGPIGGILGGIWNGLKNTVKGLFSLKGLLMVGGFLALNIMTGGALTPLMFVLGIGVGGYQLSKGLVHKDWEGMGQGIFTLGSTLIGAKFDMYTSKNAKTGENYAMALGRSKKDGATAASKRMPGIADNFRLAAGYKMQGVQGGKQNIYQVARDNSVYYWGRLSGKPKRPPGESPGPSPPTASGENALFPGKLDQQA